MEYLASPQIASRMKHGEGAVWVERENCMLFPDCMDRVLWKWEENKYAKRIALPFVPRAVLPNDHGGFLGVTADTVYLLNNNFSVRKMIRRFFLKKGEEFNDCRCGPDGSLYLGTMKAEDHNNRFLRLSPNGEVTVLLDRVSCSNGFVWSKDETVLYYTDTTHHEIYAFDVDGKGQLQNRRTVFSVDGAMPDGLTIDAEDKIWAAMWGMGAVLRVDTETGEIIDSVRLNTSYPSSVCFAGPGSHTLMVSTSRKGISAAKVSPDGCLTAGDVYKATVATSGRIKAVYAGQFHV